ncbi:hypothetical protein KUTeg_009602 [Tegillarca granosa]|uniref:Solute carrier family 13 member 5 n=1 Tax=Tegillarca granosa TaxID=220873 RepID=A0ABQ9F4D1_TEGGR|nr:hypothetical protein KUTeg_009602 [Tegillarca granosa]
MSTTFVSMWVGNIATTAMMMPIAHAVLIQLLTPGTGTNRHKVHSSTENLNELHTTELEDDHFQIEMEQNGSPIELRNHNDSQDADDYIDFSKLDAKSQRLCKATCLCICYGANLGGVGTMTGTAPNLVMKGHADLISGGQSGISFQTWFVFACPVTVINAFICWFVLQIVFLDWRDIFKRSKDTSYGRGILKQEYQKLGQFSFAEKAVLVLFVILVLLWLTLSPDFMQGWSLSFKKGISQNNSREGLHQNDGNGKRNFRKIIPLLDWQTFLQSLPWGIPVLLGGGFALAHASKQSGLSLWIADKLRVFSSMPVWAMVLMISVIVSLSTEIASNTAICTIYMPIVSDMAFGIHLHPIYLMLPTAISTSFAFMLPVATPPNAMVFALGYLKSIDMIKPGCIMNVFCALVLTIAMNTWGRVYLHLDDFPQWGNEAVNSKLIHDIAPNFAR